MEAFITWLIAFILTAVPYGACMEPACAETQDQYEQRIAEIVDSAASVVFDVDEEPLYGGPQGRYESLVHVMSVAHHESMGFRRDVDDGRLRGDKGGSGCLMGIMVGEGGKAEGWTLRQLTKERRLCFLVGYHRMKLSVRKCGKNIHGLSTYASGRCDWGRKESADMVTRGYRWWGRAKQAHDEGVWITEEESDE